MSHDAPRLCNDIRHYSRLMVLLLARHTAASGQAAYLSNASVCRILKGRAQMSP